MANHSEGPSSSIRNRIETLVELLLVFLPVIALVRAAGPWVGDDPMRGFGIAWMANGYMLAAIWTGIKLRKRTWAEMGLTFSVGSGKDALRSIGQSLMVLVIGIMAWLAGPMLLPHLVEIQEGADFSKYDYLRDNLGALVLTLAGVYFISSFAEEVIYRGFLITRLAELTGPSKYNRIIAVLLSSAGFGLIHYTWGTMGMIQTGIFGLAMGICYFLLKKRLWALILAHAYMDTLLLVNLYLAGS